ncbi:MAG: hypothetical protein HN348_26680, partial [Proteobacteria bacterium]|nr:hypothetical protein [Pseudomonadota bacterium]
MTYDDWLPAYNAFCVDDCDPPEEEFEAYDADSSGDYNFDEWAAYELDW